MIENIYRKRRMRNGKLRVSAVFTGRYQLDGDANPTEVNLQTRDQQVARSRLTKIVVERQREAEGIISPKPLREAAQRAVADHLSEYVADLRSQGRAGKYVYNVKARIGTLSESCGWSLPKDITADGFLAWRDQQKKAPKTLNEYLDAASAFLNWMHRQGRLVANPLRSVGRVKTLGREVRVRRALTDAEAGRLLAVSSKRKVVYLAAILTGLRRKELKALRWSDLSLDALRPFLTARASTTKNGKQATIWLRDDLVAELRRIKPAAGSADGPVFRRLIPQMDTFYADLASAGIAKLDANKRRVDFHCLRHTLATNLARAGVAPRLSMEVMRHGDMRLTMKSYTDASQLPTHDVLEQLPRFGEVPIIPQACAVAGGGPLIGTLGIVREGQSLSASVQGGVSVGVEQTLANIGDCPQLSSLVPTCKTVEKSGRGRIRTYEGRAIRFTV